MADDPNSNDMKHIRRMLTELMAAHREAEAELPSNLRWFVMYFHDLHSIVNMYKELGHDVPQYILREIERCDDRLRHLLEDASAGDGPLEKVRRDMAEREGNRWDHTPLLTKEAPK